MQQLVLASGSPRRKELLERLGLSFTIIPSDFDEEDIEADDIEELVSVLAYHKAKTVADKLLQKDIDETLVLGSDTLVESPEGNILAKPKDAEEAASFIHQLQNAQHRVVTAVCVIHTLTGEHELEFEETIIELLPMSAKQITSNIETEQWKGCAGGYRIQDDMRQYVNSIDGPISSVIGLPLALTVELLERFGLTVDEDVRALEEQL